MMYPSAYKEFLENIKSGEHGEEMKSSALSNSDIAIDAERHYSH